MTAAWVRAAHGDAWQVLGVAGTAEFPGVRLSATGLPHPQWNNGDVDDAARVDIAAVRRWYADLHVPWGLRVPAGVECAHGRHLFTKRLMGLDRDDFVPAPAVDGVAVRPATADDLDAVVHVDATAFEEDPAVQRPWLELLLRHPQVTAAVAELDGAIVATGTVTVTDRRAGPAGYVGGIAVLPHARGRGIGSTVSAWLASHAMASGARLLHLHPDTDEAASIYRRLGFVEVDGLDIYVDV